MSCGSLWMDDRRKRWRTKLHAQQSGRCAYCQRPLSSHKGAKRGVPTAATFDHVVPRSNGGRNHIENYVLACASCNRAKGSQSAEDFVELVRDLRQDVRKALPW